MNPALALLLLCGFALPAAAQDAKVELLVTNLNNPTGLAIQPETGHVFIADSANKRVLRFDHKGKKIDVAISGFGQDVYGKGPMYNIGPLGLGFIKKNRLVVGDGSQKDGSELALVFDLPDEGRIKADDAKFKLGPISPGDKSAMGEGNFYAVAVTPGAVFFSSNGDDTKGWILRSEIKDAEPGPLEPFIATKEAVQVDAPVGMTISPDGMLVVGQMGEVNVPEDSLLNVYDPKTGELKLNAKTGLHDIAGLAYSPSGKLYAVDFAWVDPTKGGLFRLDVKQEGETATVEAVKIASLDKPTAMAFGADGTLYVTLFGTAKEGDKKGPGQLVQVVGEW
jgi:hypothetical protein